MAFREIVEMALLLIGVLAASVVCSRLLAQRGGRPGGLLKVLDRAYLGPSKQVVLLSAGPRVIVLGVSDKGLFRLGEMSRHELDEVESEPVHAPAPGFGQALRRALRRRQRSVD
ncbi:MAG: flagellar biosynthetic protein FliO [Bacillota bacterium]|nr:flagellar biosynthetic protein FliO [Bacillota bacterium]